MTFAGVLRPFRMTFSSFIRIIFITILLVEVVFVAQHHSSFTDSLGFMSTTVKDTINDGDVVIKEQFAATTSLKELEDFLHHNPDTPAAILVPLLRKYLHTSPAAEAERARACSRHRNDKMCFGGHAYYSKHTDQKEEEIPVVLWEGDPNMNMYNLTHYPNGRKHGSLGTNMACIPLILAGFAATKDPKHVVVELGPFLGLSTKCMATGMRKNGVKNNTLFVYDKFTGTMNFRAIQKMYPWLKDEHPEYTQQNDNFQFLWEYGVKPTYPTVIARKGSINKETLNPKALGNRPVALISIDSAKINEELYQQLAGLGPFTKGSILMMMDFEFVREQIVLFFACLREKYVLPVYGSWQLEHWMWIVTEDVDLANEKHYQCFKEYKANEDLRSDVVDRALRDLHMLSGLTDNATIVDAFAPVRNPLADKISLVLKFT